jgi:hypothetical protein
MGKVLEDFWAFTSFNVELDGRYQMNVGTTLKCPFALK